MSENHLHIAVVQAELVWENPNENRAYFEKVISNLPAETELVILPEMFVTGFSMHVDACAESMDGESLSWLKLLAATTNKIICGSLMISETDRYYNRFVFVRPDHSVEFYDKRHLFSMGEENLHFTPGQERKIFKIKSFRILPQICYDLRFPVFSRNRNDYDLMINCANWPAPRQEVWDTLLKARAIENQAFVAGANRIGKDDNGINYSGGSAILDAKGKAIVHAGKDELVITAKLSKESLDNFRKRFPVSDDADLFMLK